MSTKYSGGIISLGGPGSYSNYFNGTSQYLSVANNAAFTLSTNDFTIECWFYPGTATNSANGLTLFGKAATSSYGPFNISFNPSNNYLQALCSTNGSTWGISATSTVTLASLVGRWNHMAFVRSGSTFTLYLNGVSVATASSASALYTNTESVMVGYLNYANTFWNGYISNARIVNGTALYTSTFIPPTGQLQNITNTSLLTCQSSTLVDNSSNAFTVTNNGGVVVSTITPFQAYNPNTLNPMVGSASSGAYSLSDAAQATQNRSWPAYDQYYNSTVLNLHGNGTNGAQNNTFIDSSPNSFTITRNGDATQGSFSPFSQSSWSAYTTDRSYLLWPQNSVYDLMSGDFTIEFWFNPLMFTNMYGTGSNIFGNALNDGSSGGWYIAFDGSGSTVTTMYYQVYNGGWSYNAFTNLSIPFGTWAHVAIVRSGSGAGNMKCYVNGIQQGAAQNQPTYVAAGGGISLGSGGYLQNPGYSGSAHLLISNARLTKSAVYTSNFTPSTKPLTTSTNPVWLACQDNTFINRGSVGGTATNGTFGAYYVRNVKYSPFLPSVPYETSRHGASAYFDGTGDYLSTPSNAAFGFGTGDYTLECWVYPTAVSTRIFEFSAGGDNVDIGSSGELSYYNGSSSTTSAAGAVRMTAWNHIAIVRSSGTVTGYVNGVSVLTQASTPNTTARVLNVAGVSNVWQNGFIADVRIVKGTAVYTGTFTPPIAPLQSSGAASIASYTSTANVNTTFASSACSLLLSMTNPAVIDSTGTNDFTTAGNAQISTTQSKYNGTSLYFDGTGDYLISNATIPRLGYSDFTIEWWEYRTSTGDNKPVCQVSGAYANYDPLFGYTGSGANKIYLSSAGASWDIINAGNIGTVDANTWNHFAVTRSGSTFRGFKNGVQTYTATSSAWIYQSANGIAVGIAQNTSQTFQGYIDELRVTIGISRYNGNFQPPTSPLQDM